MDAKRHSSTLDSALAAELAAFVPDMRVGDLLVALPTAVWAKDVHGRYVFANPAYMDFFEVPPGTVVVGSTDSDFFSAEDAESFLSADRRVIASGVAEHHYEAVHLANSTKYVLTVKFPLRDADGSIYAACGICLDVTESVQQRQTLEQSNQQLALREQQLLTLSRSPAIDAGDLRASLRLIATAAAAGVGVPRVGIWLWDEARESLLCAHQQYADAALAPDNTALKRSDYPAYFAALNQARSLAVHDAQNDPRTAELSTDYLKPEGICSILDTPIRVGGETMGVVCCEHTGIPRTWTDVEVSFMGALADAVGRTLIAQRRQQADAALRALNQQLEERVAHETREAHRAADEARAARQRLKDITDHIPGAVCQMLWLGPTQFRYLYMSEGITRLTGISVEDYLRDSPSTLKVIVPADVPGLIDATNAGAMNAGQPFEHSFRIVDAATGELRWLQLQARGERLADGNVLFNGTFIDITARRVLEAAAAEHERLLSAAMAGSLDGIWEWNLATDEVHFSDNWFRQLGYSPGELPMRLETLSQLCHPDDMQETFAAVAGAIEHPENIGYATEYRLHCKDGQWRWMLGRGSVSARDAHGRALRLTGTNVDIDERKHLEASLAAATHTAQEASKAKSDFLANMSHEIRTPMNAVIGLAGLLANTALNAQQRNYLTKLQSASGNLLQLINGVLDLSKIEAGKLSIEQAEFLLDATLDKLAAIMGPQAAAKGLDLQIEPDEGLPNRLIGDALRLGQVLLNLLGNAIKFTDAGSVTVVVSALPPAAPGEIRLCFAVRDTGIGIAPDRIKSLFQPFEQADASISRRYGGTGLGLAICHQLVALMGGEIGVDSTPEVGSTFWFTARLLPIEASALQTLPPTSDAPQLTGLRVLVAEDNDINLEILTEVLGRAGVDVRAARDGGEAVRICLSGWPQLVLMDMQMPDIDGLAATAMLRKDSRFARLPIVALTANAMREDRERCLAAGMNDHLAKPIDVAELYAMLERWRPK